MLVRRFTHLLSSPSFSFLSSLSRLGSVTVPIRSLTTHVPEKESGIESGKESEKESGFNPSNNQTTGHTERLHPNDAPTFLSPTSLDYVDAMYASWLTDPLSVHVSWDYYFRNGSYTAPNVVIGEYEARTNAQRTQRIPGSWKEGQDENGKGKGGSGVVGLPTVVAYAQRPEIESNSIQTTPMPLEVKFVHDSIKVVQLIRAFQVRGHFMAKLDPLNLNKDGIALKVLQAPAELDYQNWGLQESDLDREFNVAQSGMDGIMHPNRGVLTLRYLIRRLREVYCSHIGLEYMHIPSRVMCNWIRAKFETPEEKPLSTEDKLQILGRLTWSDHFELFCAQKYTTAKRFGLEGCEALIPGLKAMIDVAADLGVHNIVIGMPHRGRLNVLQSICKKPLDQIFHEFSGVGNSEKSEGSGDVKYHLGYSSTYAAGTGNKKVHTSLVANPSHLETVNPVVCGKTRAKQYYDNDTDRSRSVPILMHGDAAFSGQGVVYETMTLSDLPDYTSGGTIHVVVNNQIGFTTDPAVARSSSYCSDVAKAFNAPIFHVNGDDPEAVVRVCRAAMEWRQTFKRDVVIDMIGYRKHGHNEVDEPDFTQPEMYKVIKKKTSVYDIYCQKLLDEGTASADHIKSVSNSVKAELENKWQASKSFSFPDPDWLLSKWSGLNGSLVVSKPRDTGIEKDRLLSLAEKINTLPANFTPHRVVKTVYENRLKNIKSNSSIDWATGEALAFGSLLNEGIHVRLSGQDVERGTFSHRHAVLHDQVAFPKTYTPLASASSSSNLFSVSNSNLSEYAVLGFEYGFSCENPYALVLWEAQFGDFVNGAQIVIDQYISSAEAKWLRQSGLVLLLPHGFEGAGPEHSSCRLERFLQNSDDNPLVFPDMHPDRRLQIQQTNWQVLNCTTPANYFHALRRQICRNFRKPLIIAAPKSLLRHKLAVSKLDDFAAGTQFKRLIPDEMPASDKVTRLVFCSGKVYYDLVAYRDTNNVKNVAIARIEQLSPFPFDLVAEEHKRFPHAQVSWVQEEPMNMGAWTYVEPRFHTAMKKKIHYIGRKPSASPATGWSSTHTAQQNELVKETFL